VAIVLEKADESLYWLEILHDSSVFAEKSIHGLMREAGELIRGKPQDRQGIATDEHTVQ
jgi:hypothetical protein